MKSHANTISITLILFINFSLFANPQINSDPQNEFAPSDPGVDPSGAPIDHNLFLLVVIAILIAFIYYCKKSTICRTSN